MDELWIQGRFEGVYEGARRPGDPSDPEGARRFSLEIQSGEVSELEWIPAPLETDAPGEQKTLRQPRIVRVRLPLEDGEGPRERPLFDVRLRDWKLLHPAESKGRSFGTIVGVVEACLTPPRMEDAVFESAAPPIAGSAEAAAPSDSTTDEASPFHHADPARQPGGRAVDAPLAAIVYSRLRWILALIALGVGAWIFAASCGASAAGTWALPVAVSMLLRRLLRRTATGPKALHHWMGAAVVLAAGLAWFEPLLVWWRAGCGPALLPHLPWLAAPVVVAGCLRVRWPFVLASGGWALAVCATCWALDGQCAVPGSEAAALESAAAAPAPAPTSPPAPSPARRTDATGRWPALPDLDGARSSVARLAERMQAPSATGAPDGLASSRTGPGARESAGGGLEGGPSGPGTLLPEAGRSDGSAALEPEPPAPSPAPRGPQARSRGVPRSTRGGWVSADHRRAERDLVRISVEHANRDPDAFFGEGRRVVYIPTDRIFDPGTARIRKQGELELSRLANLLKLQPGRASVLEVHSDASGSADDQVELSERQARAMEAWLTRRGHLEPDRIAVRGVGGIHPLVPPDGSHAAQQPNRRVEVRLAE